MTRYYVHNGESYDASYTAPEEARHAAERALDGWRDDAERNDGCWADEAASVAWGEVREIATLIPHAGAVEEDGLDDRGVDYELRAPDEDMVRAALTTPEAYVGAVSEAVAEELERVRADFAALRVEHEAQRAVIDGLMATVAACQDKNRFLLDTVIAELNEDVKEARQERDELRAELDNERGVGMPPRPGWARNDFDKRRIGIAWYRPANADGSLPPADATDYAFAMWVYREAPETGWTWECECEGDNAKDIRGKAPTARRAMCMADAALAGGKS